jgi:hypothetical protein
MDRGFSFLISVGIIAFGVWIVAVAGKAASESLFIWTLVGLIPVVVGLLSLFSEIRKGLMRHNRTSPLDNSRQWLADLVRPPVNDPRRHPS